MAGSDDGPHKMMLQRLDSLEYDHLEVEIEESFEPFTLSRVMKVKLPAAAGRPEYAVLKLFDRKFSH